ncbi:UDP-glucuronosyltransferase 2C1 [Ooceraea biroi]|uniref:UDP-glucuronosyltransferase n=1 Tax=Ooceraea biroi TaxID=2015173 RepID=A0A026WVX3_OOCBI|nr:UDP-glucuronosyltransferase 2C1 [Ooceraea biroi]XP_019885816.1 UDP-glucuronosyltransferase 2C1 [Ooceraea biroi]EZA59836.1 UDP-glucuronosyltransferase 2C1 [Ooceraea biroi]
MRVLPVILVSLLWLTVCSAYRFLGIFPLPGKSHFIMLESLAKGLADKGHQVDVISPFPQKKPYPNYTDIVKLTSTMVFVNNMTYEFVMTLLVHMNPVIPVATIAGNDVCEAHLKNPIIQNLVRNPPKNPPYDAVIMELFGAHCFAAIAHLLNIPLIGVSTTSMYPWLNNLIAQPENLAFVPNTLVDLEVPMNFWQRTYNVFNTYYSKLFFNYLTRSQDDLVRKYFGPNLPSVHKMNLALMLINSHIALNKIQPLTPAAIQVGGIHIRDDDLPLPQELKRWMDDSKDGFVYFTFGSMVLIETFPQKILDVFYTSLGKIAPVRVLMKVPNPEKLPSGLPKNVYTSAWMSQLKVLRHPNVRAFITHGGLMGTLEAITCGVPMIGMPLFADQFKNIDSYVTKNIAVKLDVHKLTEQDMDAALNAILHDPRYMENVRNLSKRFIDQPLRPIDTANYWIEYVIKYGDDVLRSPAMDLTWWQLCLVDVVACVLLCVAAIITVAVTIVRFVIEMINGNHHRSLHSKKIN